MRTGVASSSHMPPRHLDTTDIILVQMMLSNSRTPSREMAEFLKTTPEEVDRRVRSLEETGVLRRFVTRLSPSHLKSVGVLVYGRSEITTLDGAIAKLSKNDSTSWVGLASGGRLYAGASLRRLSHLEAYMSFLMEDVGMQDAVFGIRSPPPDMSSKQMELTDLDYRILGSMHHDARKSAFEVAQDLGEEKVLVEERLRLMVAEKAVEFSTVLSPEAASDVLCMYHLFRRGQSPMREFMRTRLNQHSPNILFFNTYRNLPDLILAMAWVNDMAELRDIKASLEQDAAVERVEANVIIASRVVESWSDALIEERARKK